MKSNQFNSWGFADNNILIYENAMNQEEVNSAIESALSDFDIKLEGQDLLYKLMVNGVENGTINIPKDQFLNSVSYDSETKKFTFVVGTEKIEVNAEDLFEGLATETDITSINEKNTEQDTAIVIEAERATAAESELEGKLIAEQARAEAKEAELVEKDNEQDGEIAKKVDWVESTPGRKHIVLKNHDSVLGTATDSSTYNLAMVSKWDVADFGTAQLHANLNSKDGNVTINDDKIVATKDEVEAVDTKVNAIDLTPFAKTEDVTAEIASAVAPLAVKADVDATLETKADADKVYTQNEVNNMLAEKQAEIDIMVVDFKKLKEIVGDLGGAVEYSVPADGKLTDMLKKSGIIKLTEDVESNTYAGGVTSKNITTLNLGGKTITTVASTTTNPSIMVRGTQQFTITGSGILNANGHIAIEANGEDAVITLGGTMFGKPTYVTNREGELIYCYLGTINITNGVFRNDNENKAFLLNCYDANYRNGTAKIVVTGGKFYDFDPANNTSEGEGTSYVPDGYVSVASTETIDGVEHKIYTVKKQ